MTQELPASVASRTGRLALPDKYQVINISRLFVQFEKRHNREYEVLNGKRALTLPMI